MVLIVLIILLIIAMGNYVWENYPEKIPFIRGGISIAPLKLNGIIYRAGRNQESIALINQKYLKVGEVINGYKVLKIGKDDVILEQGGKRYILSFREL